MMVVCILLNDQGSCCCLLFLVGSVLRRRKAGVGLGTMAAPSDCSSTDIPSCAACVSVPHQNKVFRCLCHYFTRRRPVPLLHKTSAGASAALGSILMVVFILLSDQFSVCAAVLVRDANVIIAALPQRRAGCPLRNNQTATPTFRDRLANCVAGAHHRHAHD